MIDNWKLIPLVKLKYSGSFDRWICQDLHSKQKWNLSVIDIPADYPNREQTYEKRLNIAWILTKKVLNDFVTFLGKNSGYDWKSEYVCITIIWRVSCFQSHYNPLIVAVWRSDDLFLLSMCILFELTRYFVHQNFGNSITEWEKNLFSFQLLKAFIKFDWNPLFLSKLEDIKNIYEINETKWLISWINNKITKNQTTNFLNYPTIRFTYDEAYDTIYKNIYKYNSLIFNYKNSYPDHEKILSELPAVADYLQNNIQDLCEYINELVGGWIKWPKWYIDFYFIWNTKLFAWLAFPPTLCSRIPDKNSIALTLIHELLHIVHWYNQSIYTKITTSLWEKYNLKDSHSLSHILVYPILDKICNKRKELWIYEWMWLKSPIYTELSELTKDIWKHIILHSIKEEWKKATPTKT